MRSPKTLLRVLVALALFASASVASELLVPSDDFATIQEALNAAKDGDTIYVDDGTYDPTGGTSGNPETFPLVFMSNCTLTSASNAASLVTIDAGATAGAVVIAGLNAGAQIIEVTITGGSATGDGGGILIDGASPTLTNVTITNCVASGNGGGIACTNASAPTITGCTLSGNVAGSGLDNSGNGGGISCTGGSNPSITESTIAGNAAQSNTLGLSNAKGGGIYCNASQPTIDTNSITDNTADDSGAGIACEAASSATINHNVIASNTATQSGGGILCDGSSPQITNHVSLDQSDFAPGTISSNTASTLNGGGVSCQNGSAPQIDNNEFSGNNATADGGAVACDNSSPSITKNNVTGNIAGINGGGIAASNGSSPDVEDNSIDTNQAQGGSGGGFYGSDSASSPTVKNNKVFTNTAGVQGGGIYAEGAAVIASNTIYSNQTTAGNGGGIMCSNALVTAADVSHNLIYNNTANAGSGGGIATSQATVNIVNNTISGNTAIRVPPNGGIGGGVYVAGSTATINNCILWGDTGTAAKGNELGVNTYISPSTLTVTYSDVQGGASAVFIGVGNTLAWGTGNIDSDPLFAAAGDFHEMSQGGRFAALFDLPPTNPLAWFRDTGLFENSPCIDAGDPLSPFANELAPNGGRINMGVYGNTNEASKTPPLIQALVTSAPVQVKYARTVKIAWTLIGVIKTDKITLNRVEWGTSPFSMPKVTGSVNKVLAPPKYSGSIVAPKIPGVIMYCRIHTVINGVTNYSNIGQIIVNPF